MAKESTGGKIVMLCLPLVFAPSLAVTVSTMPMWLTVLGLSTIALAEVGAICFFFPERTVHRWYHWRAYRVALSSGHLRTEDVNRLLMSRHGKSASHHVQHHLLRLIPAKARQDAAFGRISRDWIRRRGDLSLLDDALTANLSPEVLQAHLRGTKPLDPAAVATLAALLRDTNTGDDTDGLFMMMSMSHHQGAASHCECAVAHA